MSQTMITGNYRYFGGGGSPSVEAIKDTASAINQLTDKVSKSTTPAWIVWVTVISAVLAAVASTICAIISIFTM